MLPTLLCRWTTLYSLLAFPQRPPQRQQTVCCSFFFFSTLSLTFIHLEGTPDSPSQRFSFSFDNIDSQKNSQQSDTSFSTVKESPPAEPESSTRLGKRK